MSNDRAIVRQLKLYLCLKLGRYPPPVPTRVHATLLECRATRVALTLRFCVLYASWEGFLSPKYGRSFQSLSRVQGDALEGPFVVSLL